LEHRYTLSETTKCSETDKSCDRERFVVAAEMKRM